jgi:hypothetical protein
MSKNYNLTINDAVSIVAKRIEYEFEVGPDCTKNVITVTTSTGETYTITIKSNSLTQIETSQTEVIGYGE